MIPADSLIVLDTNIVLPILRGRRAAQHLLDEYGLLQRPDRPLISSVTLGELVRMGTRRNWGASRMNRVLGLRRDLVVVDVGSDDLLRTYGELGAHAEASGRALSDNDVWIAATARVAGAVLLTADRDFDVFHPDYLTRVFVDPTTLPND